MPERAFSRLSVCFLILSENFSRLPEFIGYVPKPISLSFEKGTIVPVHDYSEATKCMELFPYENL